MAELSFEERLRTAHVTRWQIVRTAKQQSLAEHLYLVRVITLEFAKCVGFGDKDTDLAEQWALEHDVPEVRTGDLATPVKIAMREAVPQCDPIRNIELQMSDSYRDLYNEVKVTSPHVRALVKMADILEAVVFLTVEGMGPHAASVKRELWQRFCDEIAEAKCKWPIYPWSAAYDIARHVTGA